MLSILVFKVKYFIIYYVEENNLSLQYPNQITCKRNQNNIYCTRVRNYYENIYTYVYV